MLSTILGCVAAVMLLVNLYVGLYLTIKREHEGAFRAEVLGLLYFILALLLFK